MSAARVATAVILAVIGAVWIGQGMGAIPGSFMTSDLRWAVAGGALVVVAATVAWSGRR